VNAYIGARMAIGNEGLLKITANFRSVEPILSFVNDKFRAVLATGARQPGFTELSPTCKAQWGVAAVAGLDVAEGGRCQRQPDTRRRSAPRGRSLQPSRRKSIGQGPGWRDAALSIG
jgi:hypothetical protein